MNLKTYAEENGITLDEAKKLTGLTHWNQTVPESCDEIPEVPEEQDISEEVVEKAEPVKEHISPPKDLDLTKEENFSIFILGNKSPHWNK